jgi:hypothetical protein
VYADTRLHPLTLRNYLCNLCMHNKEGRSPKAPTLDVVRVFYWAL